MAKIKSRILGQDPISESDIVRTYVHVHRIKKITKETLIGLLGDRYDFTGIINDVNEFFQLALESFKKRDETYPAPYMDPSNDLIILALSIGSFVYDTIGNPNKDVTQLQRYAYFFIKDMLSSSQWELPNHINKTDFLTFIKTNLPDIWAEEMESTE